MSTSDGTGTHASAPSRQNGNLALTRVVLRPIASSAPLGFFGFAMGSFLLSGQQLGWLDVSDGRLVALVVLVFSAPLQLIAGLLAFAVRDGALATTMTVLAGVWSAFGLCSLMLPIGSRSPVLATLLIGAAGLLVLMGSGAAANRPVLFALTILASTRFAISGAYELSGSVVVERVAGWFGIPLLVIVIYGGLAFLLEDINGRPVLPTARRRTANEAISGDLPQQVAQVQQEAGVRRQL